MSRTKPALKEGRLIFGYEPKNANQKQAIDYWDDNDLLFLVGPAGTGKTLLATALALKHLQSIMNARQAKAIKEKQDERHNTKILVTRPPVEVGRSIGYLKGDMHDKYAPYLEAFYHSFRLIIPANLTKSEDKKPLSPHDYFEPLPIGFIRGRTIEMPSYSTAIFDEAQNADLHEIHTFITRLGKTGKMIITGDPSQSDIGNYSGLETAIEVYGNMPGTKVIRFTEKDNCRHPIVTHAIRRYEAYRKNTVVNYD